MASGPLGAGLIASGGSIDPAGGAEPQQITPEGEAIEVWVGGEGETERSARLAAEADILTDGSR